MVYLVNWILWDLFYLLKHSWLDRTGWALVRPLLGGEFYFHEIVKWFKINCDNIVTISCLTRQCNFSNGHLISHIAHCWSLNGQYASKKVATWNECPSCAWCRVQMASISISGPGFIYTVTCNIVTCWGDARRNDWSALWQCNWAFKTLQTI